MVSLKFEDTLSKPEEADDDEHPFRSETSCRDSVRVDKVADRGLGNLDLQDFVVVSRVLDNTGKFVSCKETETDFSEGGGGCGGSQVSLPILVSAASFDEDWGSMQRCHCCVQNVMILTSEEGYRDVSVGKF